MSTITFDHAAALAYKDDAQVKATATSWASTASKPFAPRTPHRSR
ncbi:hypothetical protein [Nonomuraea sp. NPDC049758]